MVEGAAARPAESPANPRGAKGGRGACEVKVYKDIVEVDVFDEALFDALSDLFWDAGLATPADLDPEDPTHVAGFRVDVGDVTIYFDLHEKGR